MLEVFLFNVIVGGIILSLIGLIGLELSEKFSGKYKVSKKRVFNDKNKETKKYRQVKIAKNNGKIDIRLSETKNEVA
ncbi:hypothetical protein EII29_04710 [Leptotrichia sp. OH3620_COT-345]|uniref:hypothetical protein n=1 Tax=Leptotrichia sp. OH3620_COT-345 TaxID=2491048 RepID=UPI000F65456C|nr:hypothetical protein [Leptotrichia sp. OH3620_COT-345]RRD40111.1 hypothetical protein EII29_04710 [Leptotrichia sp. OH3620_COT-345]